MTKVNISENNVINEKLRKLIKKTETTMLIAFNGEFRVDIAPGVEQIYWTTVSKHRHVLIFLKFINECTVKRFKISELSFKMTSHMIKCLVALHESECRDPDVDCMGQILHLLYSSFHSNSMDELRVKMKSPDAIHKNNFCSRLTLDGTGYLPDMQDTRLNLYQEALSKKQYLAIDFRKVFLGVFISVQNQGHKWTSAAEMVKNIRSIAENAVKGLNVSIECTQSR
ncbi:uncharacterized protein LOC128229419 isoform X1 [Mya arenaria]|uniref:uncharacterized protein LOC128229419 isoform X1 n=1 Tax=Mya arenaria TaxID=6604 RepID=UPI0022E74488|nr:uncharacterized protein LOC128229419 isoform X1 [Mya arenaria]